jgi:hypothetical protein
MKHSKIIAVKIVNCLIILSAISFTPYQWLNIPEQSKTLLVFLVLLFISSVIFFIGYFGLIKTNNPLTRWNIFSINKSWKDTMQSSYSDNPSQLFDLDSPTDEDINEKKKIDRQRKIKKLMS